jgi:hypothetical protein
LTVNVCPAIVIVPDRPGPFVEATVKFTVPLPVPLAPAVIVIHDCELAAVHAQPPPAVTVTDPLPPAGATDCESGEIENVHPFPCEIVTVCPAIVSDPDRGGPVSPATLIVTVPEPLPEPPAAIVIHGAPLDALHAHPLAAVTLIVRVPPLASTLTLSGDTSKLHPGDWLTVNTWPAIVAVPVRVGPGVPAAVTATVPGPDPDAVPTVIQSALLAAVHGHPAPVAIVTACDPPDAPAAKLCGVIA